MKRHACVPIQILLLLTLSLSACSPQPASPVPGSMTPATPGGEDGSQVPVILTASPTRQTVSTLGVEREDLRRLRIQIWHTFNGASAQALLNKVSYFNSTNDWGIIVDMVAQADATAMFSAVNSAVETGSLPDLVAALPEQTLAWDDTGVVVDLNTYLNDPIWGLGVDEVLNFPSVTWQQDSRAGRRLGMPAERSSHYLFYNLTWAQELGFEQPPATSEAFREQACAANATFRADAKEQNDGYGGWIVDSDWMGIYPWLLSFGGGVMAEGSYHFQSNPNQAALVFLKTLRDDGCAWMTSDPNNPYALDPEPHYDQFARRSALFINGDLTEFEAFSGALERSGSQDDWTVIPFPGSVGTAITVYGPSYTVFKTSPEHQLAAWLFVRWILSPANQADWIRLTGTLPVRSDAMPLLAEYSQNHPQWAAAVEALASGHSVPQEATWRTVRYILEDGTLSIFRLNLPLDSIPDVLNEMDVLTQLLRGEE